MKAYKVLNKDMTCRGYQFEEGKKYTRKGKLYPKGLNIGFSAWEYPLDAFRDYASGEGVFHEVELSGDINKSFTDSYVAARTIKIGAEIDITGLIDAAIKYTASRCGKPRQKHNFFPFFFRGRRCRNNHNDTDKMQAGNSSEYGAVTNSGYYGMATNSGDCGAAANSGNRGVAANSGYRGAAANSGDCGVAANRGKFGAATNSGKFGAATNSGYRGTATNSEEYGVAANRGKFGAAANVGDCGVAANSGYLGAAVTTGFASEAVALAEHSIAASFGVRSKAKGVLGSWIVCAEYKKNGEGKLCPVCIRAARVDGEFIEADTYYTLMDGRFVNVQG